MTDIVTPGLDLDRLGGWMDEQGLSGSGAPSLSPLGGGSQNELYVVERGEQRTVLRMAPEAATESRIDGVRREIRLLTALKGTDVPHGELLAADREGAVLGRPFLLMKEVQGWSPTATPGTGWPAPYDTDLMARRQLGFALVDGIARLARVDWRARGLDGFGRPDDFHDRQVDRWLAHLEPYRFRPLPGLDEAAAWLRRNRPRQWSPGIMHGDYQFANVMFTHDKPELAAIIDWEMTTVGDPLLDLGWALISWPPEGADMEKAHYLPLEGMPARDELLEHYERVSGRSTEDIDYYVILARWKLALVLEGSYATFVSGGPIDPKVEMFGDLVLELFRKAAELAEATGPLSARHGG